MNDKTSAYLDLARVTAAFAVLAHHLSILNNDAFEWLQNFGHAGVIAFFIISGYVIGYVSYEKESSYRSYMLNRMARIYSVMIAAWILTFLLDSIGSWLSPATYTGYIADDMFPLRVIAHITFLHEAWFVSVQWLSNQPLWSLSYEFQFYILYGLIFFLRGRRRIVFVSLVSLLVGPAILIYGLIWYAGVFIYKKHQKYTDLQTRSSYTTLFAITLMLVLAFPYWKDHIHLDFYIHKKLNPSHIMQDMVFACLISANIYFYQRSQWNFSAGTRLIRFFAGFSFSLYALHFPLIIFYNIWLTQLFEAGSFLHLLVSGALVTLTSYFVSLFTERKKHFYYRMFDRATRVASQLLPASSILAIDRKIGLLE